MEFIKPQRAGYALLGTLAAVVVIGAVVTLGFYHGADRLALSRRPAAERAALEAARAGIQAGLRHWAPSGGLAAPTDTLLLGWTLEQAAGYLVRIERAGPAQLRLTSTGTAPEGDGTVYCTVVLHAPAQPASLTDLVAPSDRTCRRRS